MEALRQITAALLLCLLAAGPASAADAASTEAPQEVALKRVNLLVSDLDRSLAVYSGILGFRVSGISESSPQSYSYAVFQLPAEARLRFATLDSSTESRALALTEVKGVVIRVTELDGRLTQLKAAGLRIVEPRRSKTPEGRAFTEAAFTDPDGHVVVLYELD